MVWGFAPEEPPRPVRSTPVPPPSSSGGGMFDETPPFGVPTARAGPTARGAAEDAPEDAPEDGPEDGPEDAPEDGPEDGPGGIIWSRSTPAPVTATPMPVVTRSSAPPPPPPTKAPAKAPATGAPAGPKRGPHTGAQTAVLPLADLAKKDGGAWKGRVKWNKSSLVTFGGERVVRVFFKKGSGTSGMAHPEASGCSLVSKNPAIRGQTGVVVAFELYFDPKAWHWSKGGKIGGLFVGPGVASGYRHSEDGASHRMMWQRDGGAISYIYPPAKLKQADPDLKPDGHGVGYFGDDKFPAGTLKVGRWNRVEIGLKINTFTGGKPNPDGKSVLTINGVSGVLNNIRWAKSPDLKIDNFGFTSFMGGPDPAVIDSVMYVKNFEVFRWKD